MTAPAVPFPALRAADLDRQPPEEHWLIQPLWGRTAAGIIGGAPKCCKTWLGLDIAVSVASGTPCLGSFPVERRGPALVYLAEDALPLARQRIESLCRHRSIPIESLDLYVITAPAVRLDMEAHREKLLLTVEQTAPRVLLLDPLVRLHQMDENSAADISRLLGYLREMQRAFDMAVILTHHVSKRRRSQPGQSLRGSSDLHAFGDSNAYIERQGARLVLTVEHRSAKAPEPIELELAAEPDGSGVHLTVAGGAPEPPGLAREVELLLKESPEPLTRGAMRQKFRVNNQRLGDVLRALEARGAARRTREGWSAAA